MARDFARRAVTAGLVPKSEFLLRVSKSPRAQMRQVARRTQDGPQGWSIAAAQHGLEFTQPFHDKRVIEFGLAIPEDLFVKEGRPRPIARAALADVYPAEFQDRLPDGEGIGPDFRHMAESIAPYLLSEIDRMEKSARLTRYFDFPRMRRMITHYPGGATHTAMLGVRAFMYARYVEWFHGDNR
jgi:asparagine synthase (glutamine-hydrolysing)